jgi:hypothetical protein
MSSYRSISPQAHPSSSTDEAVLIRVYRLPPREIGYVTSLVEASDNIALVRTLDRSLGIVECWIMRDFLEDFESLLQALEKEFPIQRLPREFE